MAKHHPIQPLEKDSQGTLRFKENKIVSFLLDKGPTDLNDIAIMNFDDEDRQQFAQLIGYSLDGYGELSSYVSDEAYEAAAKMAETNLDDKDARIASLEEKLQNLKNELREPIADFFGVHPDELK